MIVTEPTRVVGGQFTSQLVAPPDETQYIEREPYGQSTGAYRRLRAEARAYYAAQPGIIPEAAANVGGCWVSRVSATPDVWERLLRERGILKSESKHYISLAHDQADIAQTAAAYDWAASHLRD